MKVIIAGGRNVTKMEYVLMAVKIAKFDITEVVSGNAKGVDTLGEAYAKMNKLPIRVFPAEWDVYGKQAGPRRNLMMGKYADALIAVWNGKSRGTKHMIEVMRRYRKPMSIYRIEEDK